MSATVLTRLEEVRAEFGPGWTEKKLRLLRALDHVALARSAQVLRLHDLLCFLRAYPDDAKLLSRVDRMLAGFERRADFRRHRSALADSGVAGTVTRFRFFQPTAAWLARAWPAQLTIDWDELEDAGLLEALLPLLALPAEAAALDELDLPLREWVARLKGPAEGDGAFLARRFASLPLADAAREILYDRVDVPLVLAPGRGTPSRTHARHPVRAVAYQSRPLSRGRPDLRAAAAHAPLAVRVPGSAERRRLLDLARVSMVTRQRDLDAFAHGSADDVRMIEFENGLAFAAIGVKPERRLLLEAVYGFLTLQNGVPIGYVLASALFGSAEIAYNVFETWRGVEAAAIYGRVITMLRHLFGADTFTIYPYQLGDGNDEALATGAWWFYRKLGFAPRDAAVTRLMRGEERRMRARPDARSSLATLKRLARENLYFELGAARDDIIGRLELTNVGLHVMRLLARRFGSDRERGARECAAEAAALLGVKSFAGWSAGEREAWARWAPLVLVLPGVARWSAAERRGLAAVARAKGGRRESDFVARFDAHPKLRRAIVALAAREP